MPFIVTSDDITQSITRTNAAAQGVASIFASCTALDAGTKAAWTAWYTGWQTWSKANTNLPYFTLGLPALGNQAIGYEHDVRGWQQVANQACKSQVPVLQTQPEIADQNLSLPPGPANVADSFFTAVKWASIAALAYFAVSPVIEVLKRAPSRSKRS